MWYILDKDKNPVPVKDMIDATRLLMDQDKQRVAQDEIVVEVYGISITISTVFLVLDHSNSMQSEPVLFETMVFYDGNPDSVSRYTTWSDAEAGHKKMIDLVKNNIWVNRVLDKASIEISENTSVAQNIIAGLKSELLLN